MLVQRLRRWPNNNPTWDQHVVIAGWPGVGSNTRKSLCTRCVDDEPQSLSMCRPTTLWVFIFCISLYTILYIHREIGRSSERKYNINVHEGPISAYVHVFREMLCCTQHCTLTFYTHYTYFYTRCYQWCIAVALMLPWRLLYPWCYIHRNTPTQWYSLESFSEVPMCLHV